MPFLVPVIAAVGGWAAGSYVAAGIGSALVSTIVGAAVGAVVGAAIGAIGALVTGGDIETGALYGAIGGAIGGGIGGFMSGAPVATPDASIYAAQQADVAGLAAAETGAASAATPATNSGLAGLLGDVEVGTGGQLIGGGALSMGGNLISGASNEKMQKEQSKIDSASRAETLQGDLDRIKANSLANQEAIKAEGALASSRLNSQNASALNLASLNNENSLAQINLTGVENRKLASMQDGFNTQATQAAWDEEDRKKAAYSSSIIEALSGGSTRGTLSGPAAGSKDPRFLNDTGLLPA